MQNRSKKYGWLICPALLAGTLCAQKDAENVYDGNKMYHSGNTMGAQAKYAKAIEQNPASKKANFNMGNALYRNAALIKSGALQVPAGNGVTPDSLAKMVLDQAVQKYGVVTNSANDKDTLHRAWHNIGNCYLQKKDYQEAVNAYKKALRFNPKDEETRYNLAFALKHLPRKNNQGGGGQQNQPQKQNQEQKKDQQQNAQQREAKLSKEQAEQLLKSLMNSEKKLQDKRKIKIDDPNRQVDKDW